MSSPETTLTDTAQAETARRALEEVCSARDLASLPGRIIEDYAASDTMEFLRQLGVWRLILLATRHPRLVFRRG